MKITYAVTGIDEEGTIVFEHAIESQEVIDLLKKALYKIPANSEMPAPAPFEKEQLFPTKKNKQKAAGEGSETGKKELTDNLEDLQKTRRSISSDVLDTIKTLNRDGKTDAEIIEETGASKSTVYRTLRDAGLKSNKAGVRNEIGRLPQDTIRNDAMTFAKYGQVKVALEHQLPAETIAHEMHITVKEVELAEYSRNYEQYAAA